jgi:hypothetical protein
MGHGANQDQTARGEGPMWFAEAFEPVVEHFLQLPQLTVTGVLVTPPIPPRGVIVAVLARTALMLLY